MKIEHVAMYVNNLKRQRFLLFLSMLANDGYHNKNTNFKPFFNI